MKYKNAILRRKIETVAIFPIVLLGKIYGKLFPLKKTTSIFFFFSSADLGGAIKVNADIAECIKAKDPLIIFSKKPVNNGFIGLFKGFNIIDLHKKIDNKGYHFVNIFYRGVLSAWINQSKNPVVFGGECLYFYKLLPYLKKKVRTVELCHLPTWFPYSIRFIDLIDDRIFSTLKLKEKLMEFYAQAQVQPAYYSRLHFIENKIDIPPYHPTSNQNLEVIYVGRDAPQKRVYLIAAIALKMEQQHLPIHFSFVGDVENSIPAQKYPFCQFYGNIKDENQLNRIYEIADVLILTSAYEGLPIVLMQMMAYGKVVLSTAVNSIPDYVRHMENGLLILSEDENKIIEEGIGLLKILIERPELKKELGARSRNIAIEKFNGDLFCKQYSGFLESKKPTF
ncbi:MAG: glycosyltransferase family 4 protein [Bacteroidetes bacterium]|nr:glycosyltransferase family 4 protein [Bacteroidota bacterium]